jgi:hypothetical protein
MRTKILFLGLLLLTCAATGFAQSGKAGNLTWSFSGGTLTISGTGVIPDYDYGESPWYGFRRNITAVIIEEGVTRIGVGAFRGCRSLTSVTLPNSVTEIRRWAFQGCRSLASEPVPNPASASVPDRVRVASGVSGGESQTQEYRLDENCALMHIYRPGSTVGMVISYNLNLDNEVIFHVENKSKTTVKVTDGGLKTLWAKTEVRKELPIDVELGKEYYIRCGVRMGAFVGRPKLEIVDSQTGKVEFDRIGLMYAPVDGTAVSGRGYKRKEPYLSFLLSCVYPGVGQFYNGQVAKGIIMTSLATTGFVVMGTGMSEMNASMESYGYYSDEGGGKVAMGMLLYAGTLIWSIIDAPVAAGKINRRNARALSLNLGEGKNLSLKPDFSYVNTDLYKGKQAFCGLSLNLDF